jgi:hypothetical protein
VTKDEENAMNAAVAASLAPVPFKGAPAGTAGSIPGVHRYGKKKAPSAVLYYETKFVNNRPDPVRVLEYGRLLLFLQPYETRHVESRSPLTSYAPFAKVVFQPGDKVFVHANKEWTWPFPDQLCLEVLNVDGSANESLRIGTAYHALYKGIPRMVPVSFQDKTWAFVEKVEIKLVEKKVKEGDFFVKTQVLEKVLTLRPEKEAKLIREKMLAALDEKQAKDRAKEAEKIDALHSNKI